MKLSIFKGKSKYPSSQEDKAEIGKKVSKPEAFITKEVSTIDELIDFITLNHWSPMVFDNGTRNGSNFISTDFLVADIDSGMTIEQATIVCAKMDVVSIIAPSTSHTPSHHRFRVVFPLAKTISNVDVYSASWTKLAEHFPCLDIVCKDVARWYIRCKEEGIVFVEGNDLMEPASVVPKRLPEPQNRANLSSATVDVSDSIETIVEALYGEKRTKIPESVAYFLENIETGLSGELYYRGNAFLFTLALQGCEYERITEVFYSLYPYNVTPHVEKVVDRIIEEGYTARETNDI